MSSENATNAAPVDGIVRQHVVVKVECPHCGEMTVVPDWPDDEKLLCGHCGKTGIKRAALFPPGESFYAAE
jgi:ribosomal protein S27AE